MKRLRQISTLVAFFSITPLLGCDSPANITAGFSKAATVTVSSAPGNPTGAQIAADATDVVGLAFRIEGDPYQDAEFDGVSVHFQGSGSFSDMQNVRLFRDNGDGGYSGTDTLLGSTSFIAGVASFNLSGASIVPAGGQATFFVVFDFAATGAAGGLTYGVLIADDGDVRVATGLGATSPVEGAPVAGPLYTAVGRLSVTPGPASLTDHHPNLSQTDVPCLQITLEALDEGVEVTAITLTGSTGPGNASGLASLSGLDVVVDANGDGLFNTGDTLVASRSVPFVSSSSVTLALSRTLSQSAPENWLVLLDFGAAHGSGDTFSLAVQSETHLAGSGAVSLAATHTRFQSVPLSGTTQTVVPRAQLNLSAGGSTPANASVGASAGSVPMMHFQLQETTGVESVTLNSLTVIVSGGGAPAGVPASHITQVTAHLDGGTPGTFEPGTGDTLLGSGTVAGSGDASIAVTGGQTIPASGAISIWVAIDLNGTASPGASFTVRIENAGVSAACDVNTTYTASVTGGPVSGRTVTIISVGTLTVSASAANPASGWVSRSGNVVVLGLTLTMDATEAGDITGLTLTPSGSGDELNHVSAVQVWADLDSSTTVTGSDAQLGSGVFPSDDTPLTITFGTTRTVGASSSENWIVVYTFSSSVYLNQSFAAALAQNAHVTGTGATTGSPLSVTGAPVTGGTLTIEGVWTQIFPAGTAPGARIGHLCVYDSIQSRMILYGGVSDFATWVDYNDTWSMSLTAGAESWSYHLLSTQGPLNPSANYARFWHTGVFDPVGNRVVVFGGRDSISGTIWFNDVWQLSLSGSPTWSALNPSGTTPNGRGLTQAVYDSANARMMFFGGFDNNGGANQSLNDTVTLSLSGGLAWGSITAASTPTARESLGAGYDTAGGRMVIFGGTDNSQALIYSNTDALTVATPAWTAQNNGPVYKANFKAVTDSGSGIMYAFYGDDQNGPVSDVLAYDFATDTWTTVQTSGTAPAARSWFGAIWDPVNHRIIMVHGSSNLSGTSFNDVWTLN